MRHFHFTLLALCAFMITACATTDADGNKQGLLAPVASGSAIPLLASVETPVDSETMTAESGKVLFTQESQLRSAIKVNDEVKGATIPVIGIGFNITPDDVLYPAITLEYGMVYCSIDLLAREAIGLRYRVCLRDSDDDDLLDQVWTTDETGSYTGIFGVYVLKSEALVEPPVAFTTIEEELPSETMGVQYSYFNPLFGKPRLEFSAVRLYEDGKIMSANLDSRTIILEDDVSFPKTISIEDARIEVLSYDDKTITYRVLSNFGKNKPLLAIRPRAPQTYYVYY